MQAGAALHNRLAPWARYQTIIEFLCRNDRVLLLYVEAVRPIAHSLFAFPLPLVPVCSKEIPGRCVPRYFPENRGGDRSFPMHLLPFFLPRRVQNYRYCSPGTEPSCRRNSGGRGLAEATSGRRCRPTHSPSRTGTDLSRMTRGYDASA